MATPTIKSIYDKFTKGDSMTNAEVEMGINHFGTMADMLYLSGPVFRLAAIEANRVAMALEGFRSARLEHKRRR